MGTLKARLRPDRSNLQPLLLDGATGTELMRRGFALSTPLWSAAAIVDAPELLEQIHRDYVTAGCDVLTTNTFRTHARNLRAAGWQNRARELTRRATDIARQASRPQTLIAGSIAPLEDCYSPQLTPNADELESEHGQHVMHLAEAGVDLLLVETQITIREAEIAARAAVASGVPVVVSFTLKARAVEDDGPRLLSGEPLQEAIDRVVPLGVSGIGLNCIPADEVEWALQAVKLPTELARGAYANTGRLFPDGSWGETEALNPAVYAEFTQRWKVASMNFIGGCCGTTPNHVAALCAALYD